MVNASHRMLHVRPPRKARVPDRVAACPCAATTHLALTASLWLKLGRCATATPYNRSQRPDIPIHPAHSVLGEGGSNQVKPSQAKSSHPAQDKPSQSKSIPLTQSWEEGGQVKSSQVSHQAKSSQDKSIPLTQSWEEGARVKSTQVKPSQVKPSQAKSTPLTRF